MVLEGAERRRDDSQLWELGFQGSIRSIFSIRVTDLHRIHRVQIRRRGRNLRGGK